MGAYKAQLYERLYQVIQSVSVYIAAQGRGRVSGYPKELQLYGPGDDPDNDEPELTLGFKLSALVTEVKIGGLPLEELLGTYLVTFTLEGESESYHFTFMFYDGQLVFYPENDGWSAVFLLPRGPYEYDPSTATAACEIEDLASVKVNFISEDGMIHLSSAATLYGENTITVYGEGTKNVVLDLNLRFSFAAE